MKCEWPGCDKDSVVTRREAELTDMPRYCAGHLWEAEAHDDEEDEDAE